MGLPSATIGTCQKQPHSEVFRGGKLQTMFFDLKPGRLAWVVVDEKGAITGAVPGSLELLAPFPSLPSFIGEWSKEWSAWATESVLLEREIPADGQQRGLLLEAVPILPACDAGVSPAHPANHRVLICVSLPEEQSSRFASLRERFGLTTAECKVAAESAEGCAPTEIATRLGLSVQTVRSHLKRIFLKAGVHSQAGLVQALLNCQYISPAARKRASKTPNLKL